MAWAQALDEAATTALTAGPYRLTKQAALSFAEATLVTARFLLHGTAHWQPSPDDIEWVAASVTPNWEGLSDVTGGFDDPGRRLARHAVGRRAVHHVVHEVVDGQDGRRPGRTASSGLRGVATERIQEFLDWLRRDQAARREAAQRQEAVARVRQAARTASSYSGKRDCVDKLLRGQSAATFPGMAGVYKEQWNHIRDGYGGLPNMPSW